MNFESIMNSSKVFILNSSFKNEQDLVDYFKNDLNLNELREIILNYEILGLPVAGQTIFIDSEEFNNTLKYHSDNLSNVRNWKRCLTLLKYSQNTVPPIQLAKSDYFCDDVKNYVLQFLKDNYEKMKRTCKDMNEMKGEMIAVIEKTAQLLKQMFGFQTKDDFKKFSNDYTHVKEFVTVFNNLSKDHFNSHQYEEINFFDYGEIHFHLIFLLILSSSSRVKEWCSDKECRRLQTLLDNRNSSSTSTGFCDLFYVDCENNAYNIEFKYYRGNKLQFFRSKFENIEDCKITAYDQACSYQISHNGPISCFSVVFHFNADQIVKTISCDLFPVSEDFKNRPYFRAFVNHSNFELNIEGDSRGLLK